MARIAVKSLKATNNSRNSILCARKANKTPNAEMKRENKESWNTSENFLFEINAELFNTPKKFLLSKIETG